MGITDRGQVQHQGHEGAKQSLDRIEQLKMASADGIRPERGAIGVVGAHQDGSVCTTGLAVLRPNGIDSLTLAYLLKTEFVLTRLMRNNVGIAYPAINESCLPSVLLPVQKTDLPKLEKLAQEIATVEEQLRRFRGEFNKSISDVGSVSNSRSSIIMNLRPDSVQEADAVGVCFDDGGKHFSGE